MNVTIPTQPHVGIRYLLWDRDIAPGLTAEQKARALDAFAAEFASLSPLAEPGEGWGETMSYLCRRMARRHRGEPVGEWIPRWERVRRAQDQQRMPQAS